MDSDIEFDFKRDQPIQYMLFVEREKALQKGNEFLDWRHEVNKSIRLVEPLLSATDLCGQSYIEWFDLGRQPAEVAGLVLKNLWSGHVSSV